MRELKFTQTETRLTSHEKEPDFNRFRDLLLAYKPPELWNYQFSRKQPLYILSNFDSTGLTYFATSWADKVFRFITYEDFFKINGITSCRFGPDIKTEEEGWEDFREGAFNAWKDKR